MGIAFSNRITTLILGFICLTGIIVVPAAFAKNVSSDHISYPVLSATPIIEFNRIIPSLAYSQTKPLLRVFGDGTVFVHFPVYMKRSGDYSMQLSPKELKQLLSRLGRLGMFHMDTKMLKLRKKQKLKLKKQQTYSRPSGQPVRAILDADTTEINVLLDSYTPDTPDLPALGKVQKRIKWHGLRWDAEDFPEMTELQGLLEAETILEHLTRHPKLKRTGQ